MAALIQKFPLERRKIVKRFVSTMVRWLVFFAILTVALFSWKPELLSPTFFMCLPVFWLAWAVWQWVYENNYFKAYFYDAAEDVLVIRKGWITPRETNLPYEKLQDVYMDQDVFDRLFKLFDVHVSTATSMSAFEAHVDGVNAENAEAIRKLLLAKIKGKRSKVTGFD